MMMHSYFVRNSTCLLRALLLILLLPSPFTSHADRKKKKVVVKTIYDIDTLVSPIPRQRDLWHTYIKRSLHNADTSDGNAHDNFIWLGDDTLSSNVLTQAILRDAAHLDTMIENLPIADKQTEMQSKIRYLKALNNMLTRFNRDTKVDAFYYKRLVANERGLIIARHENKLMEFVQANANIYTLANEELLEGYPAARSYLYSKLGRDYPLMMIRKLAQFANEPFADSVIRSAARVAPNEIYNYATSTNHVVSGAVERTDDSLVQAIVRITKRSKSPLKAMSFLSDIYRGRKTIAEIDAITANPDLFYKNLVRLKIEGDTLGGTTYTEELQYRGIKYVRTMNELHEAQDPVRFKCIEGFTPEELYFLIVFGQDEIYTSTFIGTFNRMMDRLKPATGDQLLEKVHYEHFRTFLRMSAGYGKLDEFLVTMPVDKKTALMRDFIANLERGAEYDLEDAVDVADAYGSIKDSVLKEFLQQEVVNNYKRVSDLRSTKGVIVYGLLATIFKGGAPDSLSNALRLPPINLIPYRTLAGDSGVVFQQYFFYGDEDGKSSYASFLANFKEPGLWKITEANKNWIVIKSLKGKPVVIFANLPIMEPEGADERAQNALQDYLDSMHIVPTIVVHRGHSYHLSGTIEHLKKQSRIVMLGSCGGYHNLGQVLDHSPDAQIISTKQVGTMSVNEPIIQAINSKLLSGLDVDWIQIWNDLELRLKAKGGDPYRFFVDYVPPHRNLGAIFIKAYRRINNLQESNE